MFTFTDIHKDSPHLDMVCCAQVVTGPLQEAKYKLAVAVIYTQFGFVLLSTHAAQHTLQVLPECLPCLYFAVKEDRNKPNCLLNR